MADFLINSLRGGLNEDSPISIANDQCTVANNVEWVKSQLGERRLGSDAIAQPASWPFAGYERCVWLHEHRPTTSDADTQLWALCIDDTGPTAKLAYKDTTWHEVTISDTFAIDGVSEYQVQGQSLHGKLFIAYNSNVDRLHVFDGTSLRRTGLAESAAPTGADAGGAGSLAATARYYRVRYTVKSGSTTLRRSEPSNVLTFTPSGSNAAVQITKPASISESETHWELELSSDNANFYVIATTVVGTTTVNDTQSLVTLASAGFTLSEDTGDYELIHSVKHLSADEDRLVFGGAWEDNAKASRIGWTPVYADPGVGNDERIPLDTTNYRDLDNFDGGVLTGLSAAVNGYLFATKMSHTYQVSRTGVRTKAYEAIPLTKKRGAIPGSLVEALDDKGNPTFFALDPAIGPVRVGPRGVEPCGADVRKTTWASINLDATKVISRGCYYEDKQQVRWWFASGSANVPDKMIVLHTEEMRQAEDGMRRGWAVWDGGHAAALAVCLFADNIDSDTSRSRSRVPYIAKEGNGLIWRTEVGDDDNGTEYASRIVSKPLVHGNLMHRFQCKKGALLAEAESGALLDVIVTGDFGVDGKTRTSASVDLTPTGSEEHVIKLLDDLGLAECHTLQVEFKDIATPGAQWVLEQFGLLETTGQKG